MNIFTIRYKIRDLTCFANKCLYVTYLEPGECLGSGSGQSEPSLILPIKFSLFAPTSIDHVVGSLFTSPDACPTLLGGHHQRRDPYRCRRKREEMIHRLHRAAIDSLVVVSTSCRHCHRLLLPPTPSTVSWERAH